MDGEKFRLYPPYIGNYKTPDGSHYSFPGWIEGETPVERFDKKEWLECLHGCMIAHSLLNDPARSQRELADDGLIHELLHLAVGIEINLSSSMEHLREKLVMLEEDFAKIGDSR